MEKTASGDRALKKPLVFRERGERGEIGDKKVRGSDNRPKEKRRIIRREGKEKEKG